MRAAPLMSRAKMGTDVRVLVIEDHEQTAKLLQRGLNEVGFVVDVCTDGLDGLQMAVNTQYDLLILDVMLPTLDGWMILAGFRERDRDTPALILSARESVDDRVRGLSLGADDYLVKPLSFHELLERARVLLRRKTGKAAPTYSVADLKVEPSRLSAQRSEGPVDLSVKEFQLLELLVRHEGEVLSRSFISEQVWYERKLIHTVKGRGCVLR